MGSKGNCTLEKTLIGKVFCLFLGNPFNPANVGRVLDSGYMLSNVKRYLINHLSTKLDKKKLNTETTFIQHKDSAGVLQFSLIVSTIHGRIKTRSHKRTNTDKLPEGIDDVINEVWNISQKDWFLIFTIISSITMTKLMMTLVMIWNRGQ
jgi:hypothetical protein